jgi:hypothetical protein
MNKIGSDEIRSNNKVLAHTLMILRGRLLFAMLDRSIKFRLGFRQILDRERRERGKEKGCVCLFGKR